MITCSSVRQERIRNHYDVGTLFYRLLWGKHIHHGLWDGAALTGGESAGAQSPCVAQQQLTEALAGEAAIGRGDRVLDVGCGMGGSSIHLAKTLGCQVHGVTLSRVQRNWAAASAWWHGVGRRARFHCYDAERLELTPESFDIVWSIEATEHFFDKPGFFRRASSWLAPGGQLAICAWLAGDNMADASAQKQVYDVCEGFYCPSLGSRHDYEAWLREAGLELTTYHDWTDRVAQTWEICRRRVRQSGTRWLAPLLDRTAGRFIQRFDTILAAYRSGAMRYGCFVARKP